MGLFRGRGYKIKLRLRGPHKTELFYGVYRQCLFTSVFLPFLPQKKPTTVGAHQAKDLVFPSRGQLCCFPYPCEENVKNLLRGRGYKIKQGLWQCLFTSVALPFAPILYRMVAEAVPSARVVVLVGCRHVCDSQRKQYCKHNDSLPTADFTVREKRKHYDKQK